MVRASALTLATLRASDVESIPGRLVVTGEMLIPFSGLKLIDIPSSPPLGITVRIFNAISYVILQVNRASQWPLVQDTSPEYKRHLWFFFLHYLSAPTPLITMFLIEVKQKGKIQTSNNKARQMCYKQHNNGIDWFFHWISFCCSVNMVKRRRFNMKVSNLIITQILMFKRSTRRTSRLI